MDLMIHFLWLFLLTNDSIRSMVGLFFATFCQNLLDGLLFFQQKGSNDALTNASMAQGSSVNARYLALALLGALVLGTAQVLNALERIFAVPAFGSLAGLVDALGLQTTTRCSNCLQLVLFCVVAVARISCPAAVRHDGIVLWKKGKKRNCGGREKESVSRVYLRTERKQIYVCLLLAMGMGMGVGVDGLTGRGQKTNVAFAVVKLVALSLVAVISRVTS